MDKNMSNGINFQLSQYETPFADTEQLREEPQAQQSENYGYSFLNEIESPFKQSFESSDPAIVANAPINEAFTELLSELNYTEFETALYNLATEAEDTYIAKISNEAAMGDRYIPFVTQQINQYLDPLAREMERMLDRVSQQFNGNNLADLNEVQLEQLFEQFEFDHAQLSPAQEQFFGAIFNKVKSVVKAGVNLAKKGISAVGKILPINFILDKLKVIIRPLLDQVLRFAINKLPKNFQSHAQTLAKKFLNLETSSIDQPNERERATAGDLESVQFEFDSYIANLMFSPDVAQAEDGVQNYILSSETYEREVSYETGGINLPSLNIARQQFINDLKHLKQGESPTPIIENYVQAVMAAYQVAQPLIKGAIAVVGRDKVIDFLAGLLAKLIQKWVPQDIVKPLASQIISAGMNVIGLEINEANRADLGYEAIANTIEETIVNLEPLSDTLVNDQDNFTSAVLESFECAAANHFPPSQIKETLRKVKQQGLWVLKPRNGPSHYYKKFTHVFQLTIDPEIARRVTSFRGVPLANFLRDKLDIDSSKPIQARAHLYEAIDGTWLSRISRNEDIPGLGTTQPYGWVQLHPLSVQAASLLFKEPALGKDFSEAFTKSRNHIGIGQRFFYLEIANARLRLPRIQNKKPGPSPVQPSMPGPDKGNIIVPRSSDIQGVINFIRSEIRFNYYFSEKDSMSIVEKLNRNDYLGASLTIRSSVRNILHELLVKNIGSKVKIIHEAIPEMYLDNVREENFAPLAAVGSIAINAGKAVMMQLVEKLIDKISEMAWQALVNYFKARAAEFKQAQAQPQDGVTIKITWINVPGISTIRTIINAIRGNLSVGNFADMVLPNIPTPDVQITAGKNFD